MKKRVVITGMELTSSLGSGLENFWSKASLGQSGVKTIQSYDPSPYPTRIAGEIRDLPLDDLPEFNKSNRYTKTAQYALFCAHHAIRRAGLEAKELQPAGTFIGTSLGGHAELADPYRNFFVEGWKKIPALSVLKGMPNSVSNFVAIAFGLGGPNSTLSNACVSSAEAIGYAYQQISQGRIALALAGGTESLIWEPTMAAWCKMRVMSTNNEAPEQACAPFDRNRDGMVMADGAGMLVLEEYEHARARGANILAEITGFGASCDAHHITAPSSEGQCRAIQTALDEARVSSSDIQYINAHGTATSLNDSTETTTIKSIFGERAYSVPVSSQKSMLGHSIGAAGVIEIIATVLMMQHGLILPTINLNTPDPACDLDYVPNQARIQKVDIALSNHFAFGGSNAALILSRA